MNREEAMDKATEIVEKLGNSPDLNSRGYKVDGWKPPTLTERVAAIETLANFLWEPEPEDEKALSAKLVPPAPHVHRASCDDAGGNHVCGHP